MNILLDYLFPITAIDRTPAASTAFLKQACIVGLPADSVPTGIITKCTTIGAVEALLSVQASAEAALLFQGGLSSVYVLPSDDLDLASVLASAGSDFYTLIISSDYADGVVTGADFGVFPGVIAAGSTDDSFLATQAAIEKRSAWHCNSTNKRKNMCFAFGKLLSNALNWRNQQYISMPLADDVDTLGAANGYFDDKISFVLSDDQYSSRLGLFAAGGASIASPYIKRNLQVDQQSKALAYIAGNQPGYTHTQAALLQDELAKVIALYIERQWIEGGVVTVSLDQDNFVASGNINIVEPKALWRIFGEMRATL